MDYIRSVFVRYGGCPADAGAEPDRVRKGVGADAFDGTGVTTVPRVTIWNRELIATFGR
jgi:hypothetical protein